MPIIAHMAGLPETVGEAMQDEPLPAELMLATDHSLIVALARGFTPERYAAWLGFKARAKRLLAAMDEMAEEAALDYCETVGDFTIGEVRYFPGVERDKRVRDTRLACEAVLKATGGDLDALFAVLKKDAVKHGALESVIGEAEAGKHIEITERPRLKEGKPKKRLLSVNPRFTQGAKP